uniref:Ribosomal RNA-processing protein 42 n=1 Tax=Timspurckia oligopyrenoides TaxID=708627 RepID=A0A7S0ZJH7_9RHOD|mmetsp:Transcript_7764/g.14091  ORF Transcript_7764/g.14091 Transcript_7764/m.14091 type:complete len:316 (+) Transcript_7764:48-995(+)
MEVGLSVGESAYIRSGISCGVRCDGRGIDDIRRLVISCNPMPHAMGSSRVQFGEHDILVGTQLQLESHSTSTLTHSSSLQSPTSPSRSISFSLDFARSSSSFSKTSLSLLHRRLSQLYASLPSNSIQFQNLFLIPHRLWWRIHVHILILQTSPSSSSLFDTITIAVRSALQSTKVPVVSLQPTDADQLPNVILPNELVQDIDEDENEDEENAENEEYWNVDAEGAPVHVTVCIMEKGVIVVDPDWSEEESALAVLGVSVSMKGNRMRLCGVTQKTAVQSCGLNVNLIRTAITRAQDIAQELILIADQQVHRKEIQ